jgi:predicted metalloprotease with PDZ domain
MSRGLARRLCVGLALVTAVAAEAALPAGTRISEIEVDATEIARHITRVRLRLPVEPGEVTLQYPRWIPGTHGPTGPLADVAGLTVSAGTRQLDWHRDPVDLYSVRVQVPDGVDVLDVRFDFLSGNPDMGMASYASSSTELALLRWNRFVMYPDGAPPAEQLFALRVRLPEGWRFATVLPRAADAGVEARFAPVDLDTLVDAPLLAGRHLREWTLDDGPRPVRLAAAAESAAALQLKPEIEASLRRLVRESDALFGTRHFRQYLFLVALSDQLAQFGLESHESSENRIPENSFTNPALAMLELGLLSHEYVHSWNGKYRRPLSLTTANFQTPMQGDLLWVYEGLTQYLGYLLAARSGIWTAERYRDRLASSAAYYSVQPGRRWRPLLDTAVAAPLGSRTSPFWRSLRRGSDYYNEGALIWLEADMLIRAETRGRRSLDDFCRTFFAGRLGSEETPRASTYTVQDVHRALDAVLEYDWPGFFAARLEVADPPAPTGGVELAGWQLVFSRERNGLLRDLETLDSPGTADFGYSLGVRMGTDGLIDDLYTGSAAAAAGLVPGMKVIAVNGRRFSVARLREALEAGASAEAPIGLLVEQGDRLLALDVRSATGLREPRLERRVSGPDRLSSSIAPRAR